MKRIKINPKKYTREDVDLIVDYLQKEKVVVLPTDTVYGLHALASSEKAIKKIYKIKERESGFGLVHLMKSYCQVHNYCYVSKKQDQYMREYWAPTTRDLQSVEYKYNKKPTTFVLRNRGALPNIASGKSPNTAVRLPKNDFLLTILKRVNLPLVSTSFNVSGKEEVLFDRIEVAMKILPDLLVDAGKIGKKESRIIDISDFNNIKTIRQ